jgi:hypothetical protein
MEIQSMMTTMTELFHLGNPIIKSIEIFLQIKGGIRSGCCWTTERGGESVVTMLKQSCFF